MASPGAPPWSAPLADAVRSKDSDAALQAGLAAVDAKASAVEIACAAALPWAESVDVSGVTPFRGLIGLSSGLRLSRHLAPRLQALPVLRGLSLAATDPKLPPSDRRRRVKVAGEISHLTRSFEYAVRTGEFSDAVSIFTGHVPIFFCWCMMF